MKTFKSQKIMNGYQAMGSEVLLLKNHMKNDEDEEGFLRLTDPSPLNLL